MKELMLRLLPEFLKPLIGLLFSKLGLLGICVPYLLAVYYYVKTLLCMVFVVLGTSILLIILSYVLGYLQSRNKYKPSIKNLDETDNKILKLILEAENTNTSISEQHLATSVNLPLSVIKKHLIKLQTAELIGINQHDVSIHFRDTGREYTLTLK